MKVLFIIVTYFLSSCYTQTGDPKKLCIDFYNLNKGKDFNILLEVSTTESRFRKEYNSSKGKYEYILIDIGVFCLDPNVKGDFITIPLKYNDFNNFNTYGSSYFYKCKGNNMRDPKIYNEYISKFLKEYNSIDVPNYFKYEHVKIDGNPKLGNFIEFVLNKNISIYYLKDKNNLKPYWKLLFNRINRIDNYWYFHVKR